MSSDKGEQKGDLYFTNFKLFKYVDTHYLEFPPLGRRKLLVEQYHCDLIHCSAQRLYEVLRKEFYWPSMKEDCNTYTQQCLNCQLQPVKFRQRDDIKTTFVGTRPRQIYSIDLIPHINPIGTKDTTQIIVLVNNFSKYVTLGALPNKQSSTLATWFLQSVICQYGTPQVIKSDQGNEFQGVFQQLCDHFRIKHHVTLAYHPQGNGIAERFVRIIKNQLIRYLAFYDKNEWDTILPQIAYAINTTTSTTHGYTPFQLQYGTSAGPLDNKICDIFKLEEGDEYQFYTYVSNYLESVFMEVTRNLYDYQESMRRYYANQRIKRPAQYVYKVGDLVMIRNFTKGRLKPNAIRPFKITSLYSRSAQVQSLVGNNKTKWHNLKDIAPAQFGGIASKLRGGSQLDRVRRRGQPIQNTKRDLTFR